jgi:hypothetical protein
VALYYIGLACLFTHELDAVTHSEWRLLFGLRSLPDSTAESTFVALHVPLFFVILWLSHYPARRVSGGIRLGVAAFMIVHGALHFASSSLPEYTFEGSLSNFLIYGAALSGAAFLAKSWSEHRTMERE